MVWNYAELHTMIEDFPQTLSAAQEQEVLKCGYDFLRSHHWMAANALGRRQRLYKLIPKHHLLDEMLQMVAQDGLNWRHCQTYAEEDLIRRVRTIAQRPARTQHLCCTQLGALCVCNRARGVCLEVS